MSASLISPRFHEAMARIVDAKPTLVLQTANKLTDTTFRITAAHGPHGKLSETDYGNMVLAATDNEFRLLPDTLDILGKYFSQIAISGLVEAHTTVKDFSPAYAEKYMKVLAENMFMDNQDSSLWRLVSDGDNKYLVQSVQEDYSKMIGARLARSGKTAAIASVNFAGMVPANADYIAYLNAQHNKISWGYALACDGKLQVLDRTSKELVEITPMHVITAADGSTLDGKYNVLKQIKKQTSEPMLADDFTPAAQNVFLDYMRSLYADTDFFKDLERLIMLRRRTDIGQMSLNQE